MIRDLISRLLAEATEEASHKGWCNSELLENQQVRTSRTTLVDQLSAKIDSALSAAQRLADEVATHQNELQANDQNMQEQVTMRDADKELNTQTIKDAKDG